MGQALKADLFSAYEAQQDLFTRTSWSGAPYTLADVLSGDTLCGYLCDTPIPLINGALADNLWNQYKATETATFDLASGTGGTYKTNEDTAAGYGQLQYRSDRWYVVGGVRVESTTYSSSSTQATNGVYAPVSALSSYTKALPSVSAVYDTGDYSKLRLSASETLSRPTFAGASLHGGVLNTTTNPPTLSVGNPDLRPPFPACAMHPTIFSA